MSEGATQNVVLQLDEPIIALTPDPTLTLTFTIGDPSRVSVSAGHARMGRDRMISHAHPAGRGGVHDPSNTVIVHVTTTSESEYCDGFTTAFHGHDHRRGSAARDDHHDSNVIVGSMSIFVGAALLATFRRRRSDALGAQASSNAPAAHFVWAVSSAAIRCASSETTFSSGAASRISFGF